MVIEELIALLGFQLTGEEQLKRFTSGIETAGRTLVTFAARAAVFSAAAATAIGGGLAILGKSAITTGAEFEDLSSVLETIEGSSDKAKASLDWVQQFATKTPYDLKTVADAFVSLKAYGLEPMGGLLESIGNATSAMNKPLQQGVEAIADAVRGENERLKEFGIVGKKAGDQFTYSWTQNGKTMTKTVKNDAIEIQKTLMGIFDSRFLGAMDKRSKTFNGMLSNLGDTWTNFLRKIADAGWFKFVETQLSEFMANLQALTDSGVLDALAKSVSDTLVAAGQAVKDLVSNITLEDVTKFITGSINFLVGVGRIAASIGQAIGWLGKFVAGILGLQSAWQGLAVLLAGAGLIFAPVTTAMVGIALAIDDFVAFLQGRPSVIGDALAAISRVFTSWAPGVIAFWDSFVEGFKSSGIGQFFQGVYDQLAAVDLGKLFDGWTTAAGNVWGGVKKLGTGLYDVGKAIAGLMPKGDTFDALAKGLGQLVGGSLLASLQTFKATIETAANAFGTIGNVLSRLSQGDLAGAFGAFVEGIKAQGEILKQLLKDIVGAFAPNFDFEAGWDAILAYFDKVGHRLEIFAGFIEQVFARIKAAFSIEPPAWVKTLMGTSEEAQTNAQAVFNAANGVTNADGSAATPKPADVIPAGEFSLRGILRDLMAPVPQAAGAIQAATGDAATGAAAATVANDNRVANTTNTINAPVTINATTNATAGQIGAEAGGAVRAAGNQVNRNLAVTANPGGMSR